MKYVLEQAKIDIKLPEAVKPEDFKKIEGLQEIYKGLLKEYQVSKTNQDKDKIV